MKNRRLSRQGDELLSKSVSNYLTAILYLSGGRQSCLVKASELARYLHVSPPSITNMVHRLMAQKHSLILHREHHGVRLSALGQRRALQLVRRHRLLTTFLRTILDFPLAQTDEEAARMEHVVSSLFEERLAAKLGNPKTDSFGRCIPTRMGAMPETHGNSCRCLERVSGCGV